MKVVRHTKKDLNKATLINILKYEKSSGYWFWRENRGKVKKGDRAGSLKNGYIYICVDKIRYKSSRLAFLYMLDYIPKNDVRHENGIKSDDRWINLIEETRSEIRKHVISSRVSKTGVSGLTEKHFWSVYISNNGERIFLGDFYKKDDAVMARWRAEVKYKYPHCYTKSTAYKYLKKNGLIAVSNLKSLIETKQEG